MDHFERVYRTEAAAYDRLVVAEDVDGHLPALLARLLPGSGLKVLDVGTGTGRVARLIAPRSAVVVGVDLHEPMLREQQARAVGPLAVADGRQLPVRSGWADVVVAGWAIGHLTGWRPDDWRTEAARLLTEMTRTVRPGGTVMVMETLGTGSLVAAPPVPVLGELYDWFEQEQGFVRHEVATDYGFTDADEAVAVLEFFFGPELVAAIRANRWARVPEWTGVWVR